MNETGDSQPEPRSELPRLALEQLALGELDPAAEKALRERHGDWVDEELRTLEASNSEILADYPAAAMAARIRQRAEASGESRSKRRAWAPWVFAPTLVAAAAVVWIVVGDGDGADGPSLDATTSGAVLVEPDGPEPTRIKGGVDPHVVIDRRTSEGHERLTTGERVRAGDLLQVSYVGAGHRHGVIVSLDGAGVVTLHHPASADDEPVLAEGKEVPLASSYELDDAPGYERFVFVTRDDEVVPDVDEVLRAAEALASDSQRARDGALPLEGEHWRQQFVLLPKAKPLEAEQTEGGQPVPAGVPDERGGPGE